MSLFRGKRVAHDFMQFRDNAGNIVIINGKDEFLIEYKRAEDVVEAGDPLDEAWSQEIEDRALNIVDSGTLTDPTAGTVITTPRDYGNGAYRLVVSNFTTLATLFLVVGTTSNGRKIKSFSSADTITSLEINSLLITSDSSSSPKIDVMVKANYTFLTRRYLSPHDSDGQEIYSEIQNTTSNENEIKTNLTYVGSFDYKLIKLKE